MKKMWHSLLASDDLRKPLVAPDEIDEVVSLMVESRIDPEKFLGNLGALVTMGIPYRAGLSGAGGDPLPTTPSISKFTSVLKRPRRAPLWLLAGFPDVVDWLDNKQRELLFPSFDETELIIGTAELFGVDLDSLADKDENYIEDSEGNLRTCHYRNLVSNYVRQTGKSLEVAVGEGSENDIYLVKNLLQIMGEESNFTLIAAMTTKYYIELKRTYGSSLPDETTLLAMSGILDANVYIFVTQQVNPAQIIDLARATEGKQDRLLEFLIQFESLLLSVDRPDLPSDEILTACQDQAETIRGSIHRTMDSYNGEPGIISDVRAVMSSAHFAQLRHTVGVRTV